MRLVVPINDKQSCWWRSCFQDGILALVFGIYSLLWGLILWFEKDIQINYIDIFAITFTCNICLVFFFMNFTLLIHAKCKSWSVLWGTWFETNPALNMTVIDNIGQSRWENEYYFVDTHSMALIDSFTLDWSL